MKLKTILLMSLMTVLLIGLVEATLTINATTPQTGSFNLGAGGTYKNYTYCNWTVYTTTYTNILQNISTTNYFSSTAKSSESSQANNTRFTLTSASNNLQDATYTFGVTCENETGEVADTGTKSIAITATSPNCIVQLPYSSGNSVLPDATWTLTTGNATSAILYFGAGNPKIMSLTSASNRQQSWSFSSLVPKTTYDHVYTLVKDPDGSETKCDVLDNIHIEKTEKSKGAVVISEAAKKKSNILVILIVIIVVILLNKQGKKRK